MWTIINLCCTLIPSSAYCRCQQLRTQKSKQVTGCTTRQVGNTWVHWIGARPIRIGILWMHTCSVLYASSVTVLYPFLDHSIWHCSKLTHASTGEPLIFWLLLIFSWAVASSWYICNCMIPCSLALKYVLSQVWKYISILLYLSKPSCILQTLTSLTVKRICSFSLVWVLNPC